MLIYWGLYLYLLLTQGPFVSVFYVWPKHNSSFSNVDQDDQKVGHP